MLANAASSSGDEGFPKESLALLQLKKDTFKYTPGLGCEVGGSRRRPHRLLGRHG